MLDIVSQYPPQTARRCCRDAQSKSQGINVLLIKLCYRLLPDVLWGSQHFRPQTLDLGFVTPPGAPPLQRGGYGVSEEKHLHLA